MSANVFEDPWPLLTPFHWYHHSPFSTMDGAPPSSHTAQILHSREQLQAAISDFFHLIYIIDTNLRLDSISILRVSVSANKTQGLQSPFPSYATGSGVSGSGRIQGGPGSWGSPRRRHRHDSIRLSRLTAALGLKLQRSILVISVNRTRHHAPHSHATFKICTQIFRQIL